MNLLYRTLNQTYVGESNHLFESNQGDVVAFVESARFEFLVNNDFVDVNDLHRRSPLSRPSQKSSQSCTQFSSPEILLNQLLAYPALDLDFKIPELDWNRRNHQS